MTAAQRLWITVVVALLAIVAAALQTQPAPHEGPIDTVDPLPLDALAFNTVPASQRHPQHPARR